MIYFETSEIIFSIYTSAILGLVFGFIYSSSLETLGYVKKFIYLPFQSAKNAVNFSIKRIFIISFEKNNSKIGKVSKNLYEFLIFTIFGCITILLSYVALDGVFRLYVLVIIGLFFILSKRTLGNLSEKILKLIYSCMYFITSLVISAMMIPIARLTILAIKKYTNVANITIRRYTLINSDRLIRKKKKEIQNQLKAK